jgi:hypothetical protein
LKHVFELGPLCCKVNERMAGIHQLDQTRCVNMCVNLSCGDICVAKHCLQRPQIGPSRKQVRGKSVTENVRAHLIGIKPRRSGERFEHLKEPDPRQMRLPRRK